jgi:hypothetical protein
VNTINTQFGQSPTVVVNGATSLPFPPLVSGGNVTYWNGTRAVPAFDVEVWSTGTVNLTLAELFGGALHAGTIGATALTSATNATNLFTLVAHGLHTGDGPVRLTTTGTLPGGTALATDYWVVRLSADTFSLATSLADALAGTVVDLTTDGTGVHTVTGTGATKRMHFHSCGLLGVAADGAIGLTDRRGYNVRVDHRPNVVMYWMTATLSAGIPVFVNVYPVQAL